jgi:hypothetical protein
MQAWELLSQFRKVAGAPSVPLADPAIGAAATAPLPELAVGNKPAPGLSGPKGLAPRTNYSRVNSGSPPPADLGASTQKGLPTDPQGFLPPKVAHHEVPMSAMTQRFTIQEMIKAATQSVSDHASVALEGNRQLANAGEKVASAKPAQPAGIESIPTNYVEKLAAAVAYVTDVMKVAEEGAGTGPNALHVMEATSSNNEIEAGHSGTATPAHVPPKNPGEHKPAETPKGPATALEDNASMMHKEQPVKLSHVAELRKAAAKTAPVEVPAKVASPVELLRKVAKFPIGGGENKDDKAREPAAEQAAEKKLEAKERKAGGGEGEKEASAVDPRLVDYFLTMTKSAEDAINPAKISAGAAVPPETSAAGESGGAPAGGMPEGPRGLVGSNESAINYQKREAKAPVKAQLAKVLTEPALSAAHDRTLEQAFDNTGKAGVKIASSTRAMAARAVLEKMAEEACGPDGKSKKKVSAGMGAFQAPQVGGAASSAM